MTVLLDMTIHSPTYVEVDVTGYEKFKITGRTSDEKHRTEGVRFTATDRCACDGCYAPAIKNDGINSVKVFTDTSFDETDNDSKVADVKTCEHRGTVFSIDNKIDKKEQLDVEN